MAGRSPKKAPTHEVSLNLLYLHYGDARTLRDAAEEEQTARRSVFARHSILAAVFAGEALMNRLLDEHSGLPPGSLEKLGLREKCLVAPLICGDGEPKGKTFDAGRRPFQEFAELIQIRNWFAHPKKGDFVGAIADGTTITLIPEGKVIPLVETLPGKLWPQTKIPRNPFELTAAHAQTAIAVQEEMMEELKALLPSRVHDWWLGGMELRERSTGKVTITTTDSLWGGYTPKPKTLRELAEDRD